MCVRVCVCVLSAPCISAARVRGNPQGTQRPLRILLGSLAEAHMGIYVDVRGHAWIVDIR